MRSCLFSTNKLIAGIALLASLPTVCQALPDELIEYLQSLDVEYRPIERNRLLPEFLAAAPRGDTQLMGDFNGDHIIDIALLATNRGTYVSLLVFLRSKNGFDHYVLFDRNYAQYYDENRIEEAIYPVIGEIRGPDETLELQYLGIYSAAKRDVFYWRNNEFHRFLTED